MQQPSHDAAHEEHRDKDSHQRDGHGNDGETDFLGSQQCGLHAPFAHLHVADDVLQHDDGVVHHKADRKSKRHQREIVQAVAQQVHGGERADDGKGHCEARNQGGAQVPQEDEDDHHHQAHR